VAGIVLIIFFAPKLKTVNALVGVTLRAVDFKTVALIVFINLFGGDCKLVDDISSTNFFL